jgi:NADH dehydrogenase (ubiquinone) 1 beta subcomplex subunit 10
MQFKRDKMVDSNILSIVRNRFEDCMHYETPDHLTKCKPLKEAYEAAAEAWFMKCNEFLI